MSDQPGPSHADPVYTDEEVAAQARQHASVLPYLMTAFALECGRTPDEAAAFVGRDFAPGWEAARGQGALVVVRSMALNLVAAGGALRSLGGDEGHAEARVAGLAGEEELAFMGPSREEAGG